MTKEILNRIAKAKKVNLSYYDHVLAFINENYTKVIVSFGLLEVCGGHRYFCCQKDVVLSVAAIQKREEPEWEYTTQGWEEIATIR